MLEHPGSRFERHRHSRKSRRFMSLSFTKMHGAGNDFVLLDGRDGVPAELDEIARAIGDRHMGVGFDQLLVVRPGASHPYHMEIWNSDGSLAEMCGNGIRCFAKWLFDQGELSSGPVIVETAGGPRRLEIGGYVNGLFEAAVGMGVPDFEPANIPMRTDGPRQPRHPATRRSDAHGYRGLRGQPARRDVPGICGRLPARAHRTSRRARPNLSRTREL